MKVAGVKAFVVDELGTNRVFARVYTDEGLTGLGEGTLASRSQAVAAAIVENERYLIDQDPRDIEGLWQHMYRRARFRGGPVLGSALSAGERLITKWGFADLIARYLVSYVQPDIAHAGGITELKKISTLAQSHFIDMAPHHGNSEVTTFASLHVDASSPNCVIQERSRTISALSEELLGGTADIRDGYAALPDKPGLGLDLNEKIAAKHPFNSEVERTDRARLMWPDGAMTDP